MSLIKTKNLCAGDKIRLGYYKDTPIYWLKLTRRGGDPVFISELVLDMFPYTQKDTQFTFELDKFMNSECYTEIPKSLNPWMDARQGLEVPFGFRSCFSAEENKFIKNIRLPSLEEMDSTYFRKSPKRASFRVYGTTNSSTNGASAPYWLSSNDTSPGISSNLRDIITRFGRVSYHYVGYYSGFRPVCELTDEIPFLLNKDTNVYILPTEEDRNFSYNLGEIINFLHKI